MFMYGYLKSDIFIKQIETFATGAAQKNFGPMHLSSIKIKVPSEEILENFTKFSSPLYKNIDNLRTINRNLEQTKSALLPRLISGKLSVENLDIEFPPSLQ